MRGKSGRWTKKKLSKCIPIVCVRFFAFHIICSNDFLFVACKHFPLALILCARSSGVFNNACLVYDIVISHVMVSRFISLWIVFALLLCIHILIQMNKMKRLAQFHFSFCSLPFKHFNKHFEFLSELRSLSYPHPVHRIVAFLLLLLFVLCFSVSTHATDSDKSDARRDDSLKWQNGQI